MKALLLLFVFTAATTATSGRRIYREESTSTKITMSFLSDDEDVDENELPQNDKMPITQRKQQQQSTFIRQSSDTTTNDQPQLLCQHALTTISPMTKNDENNTESVSLPITSYGMLFPILSSATSTGTSLDTTTITSTTNNNNNMVITSLGFYVHRESVSEYYSINNAVDATTQQLQSPLHYEVYTTTGYYADPQRTNSNGPNGGVPLDTTWDYRGDLTKWDIVAEGELYLEDLAVWLEPRGDNGGNNGGADNGDTDRIANYFQIPFEQFTPVSIVPEGVQSIYITIKEVAAMLYYPIENWEELHDVQTMAYCGVSNNDNNELPMCIIDDASSGDGGEGGISDIPKNHHRPILQIGEGVISYPFYSTPYFYIPRKFMGTIYYSDKCPTSSPSAMPSISLEPTLSFSPSSVPTITKSVSPSHSLMPSTIPSMSAMPSTLAYINADENGCHKLISTDSDYYDQLKNDTIISYGILFSIRSNENDGDGVWITSLGFHVALDALTSIRSDDETTKLVNYEVYALEMEGLYADPNRTEDGNLPMTYDYRGNFSYWKPISNGTVGEGDLTRSYDSSGGNEEGDSFQIPWENFQSTNVPPYGGMRSFYVTLSSGAFVYKDVSTKQGVGTDIKDDGWKNNNKGTTDAKLPPILQVGEGVIGYPFHDMPFLYAKRQFVGTIFYEWDCPSQSPSSHPSQMPSISTSPSSSPSQAPTISVAPTSSPSQRPSVSSIPSLSPSLLPSKSPNNLPSNRPSISEKPSTNPNFTSKPSSQQSREPSNNSCATLSMSAGLVRMAIFVVLLIDVCIVFVY